MSKTIRVVGVDPSMSNFGLAIGTLDLETVSYTHLTLPTT